MPPPTKNFKQTNKEKKEEEEEDKIENYYWLLELKIAEEDMLPKDDVVIIP
jgi:hypothetical protein